MKKNFPKIGEGDKNPFKPGDKVYCIKGSASRLTQGEDYTVRSVSKHYVHLQEKSGGWYYNRFRKSLGLELVKGHTHLQFPYMKEHKLGFSFPIDHRSQCPGDWECPRCHRRVCEMCMIRDTRGEKPHDIGHYGECLICAKMFTEDQIILWPVSKIKEPQYRLIRL